MLRELCMLLQFSLESIQQAIGCFVSARPRSHAQEPSSPLQEVGTSSSGHSHTLQSRSMHMPSSGQKGQSHQRLTCRFGHQHNRSKDVAGVLTNSNYVSRPLALRRQNAAQPDTTSARHFAGKWAPLFLVMEPRC